MIVPGYRRVFAYSSFAELLVLRVQRVLRMRKSRVLVLTDVIPEHWRVVQLAVYRPEDGTLILQVSPVSED